ncbi:MAG TPA: tetratricopeptide repeat protein, partial [Nitrososphaera sp.]|nr:tetratricopeptide repeat protein [Nitrososphaera sp.]
YAVKYKSDKVEAWRALAGINERVKAYNLLFDDLRRIVELDPTDVEARIKLGKMLLAGGASEAALKVVERGEDPVNKNADLLALKASILLKMKDSNAGLAEARTVTELDPGNVDAAVILALDKTSRGDLDGAIKILSAPAISSKNDPRVDQIQAQIFAKKGDFSQAQSILQKLIDQKPQDIALHDQLVRIFVAQRRFDDAEKELRTIATANPGDVGAQLNLVRFLGGIKGPGAARDELVNRIKAGGDVFPYQMALADIDFEQGKVDESAALLEGLIAANSSPEHTSAAQAKLAELYLRKANYPAAEKLATDILNKDPRSTAGLRIRASIRMEQGQLESAIADLREALNGQPKSSQLLLLLALAYERDGKLELADRQYAEATKSASGNPGVSLQYVAFLQRQGRIAQAEDVLTAAVSANPSNIDLLGALAQIRLGRQNWTGALAVADSIQAIGNERGVAEEIRGIAFAGQGKMEQSIAALEAAHASRPDAMQPVVTLVTAYLRTGKTDKAETLLKDMLKKYPEDTQLSLLMGSTQLAKNNDEGAISNFKGVITQRPKDASG